VREQLAHGDVAVDAAVLQHDPHAPVQLARAPSGILAEHRDDPTGALAVPLEDLDRRRLARAVGPQKPEDLTPRDLEVDAADGLDACVRLVKIADEDGGLGHGRPYSTHVLSACIDIGSNTTRLLVARAAEGRLQQVMQQRTFTKLGVADRSVPPQKISEVAEAVAEQVRLARECGCGTIRAVGTHAIRQAGNRDALLTAIAKASGVEVDVLTGDEEARYAFLGATHTLGVPPEGEVGVVDVGGGSTELVCGTLAGGVAWAESFRIGSGSLASEHLRSDPPTDVEIERARVHAARAFESLDAPRPQVAYAVGGSATSLRRLAGGVLDEHAIGRAIEVLSSRPAADIARAYELHVERVRLLPAGILLLDAAAKALGATLQIANGGLREGVLLEQLLPEGVQA
jgi:exopolyphosphatase/guanosine-5'-triphosphate,3'-diphosphate pyrophosphatase